MNAIETALAIAYKKSSFELKDSDIVVRINRENGISKAYKRLFAYENHRLLCTRA